MKVILLKDMKSLGKKGDVVDVSDGYARNFILPTKAGVIADKKNMNVLKQQLKRAEKEAAQKLEEAKDLKARIEDARVVLSIRAGKEGKAFGAVSTKEVAEALKNQAGIEIDKKKIEAGEPIKAAGDYELTLKLHKEVNATLKVHVEEV